MPFKDPKKRKEYRKQIYDANRKKVILRVKDRKKKLAKWFFEYKKGLKCSVCSESHPATIDFHHLDIKKKDNGISHLVYNGYSIERIKQELAKCEVLCANCHRKAHYQNNKV